MTSPYLRHPQASLLAAGPFEHVTGTFVSTAGAGGDAPVSIPRLSRRTSRLRVALRALARAVRPRVRPRARAREVVFIF
eukprot:COSAG02_NODE_1723_length_11188_cov_3.341510_6_plen_79_part_00